jgi:AAA family ATP:ADP antiporter
MLERLASKVVDVRREEIASVLLMTLLIFFLLAAYYLLKTVREVLILTEGGAEVKSYSSAGQAVLLLFLVPAYGAFASRVKPVRLVSVVSLFFASHLILFMIAIQAGMKVGIAYFLWVGIFNLMVVAQFWAFAADLYTEEQGKRLFPIIGVGGSLGAWLGALRAGILIEHAGPTRLLLGAFAVLAMCAALVPIINRAAPSRGERRVKEAPVTSENGFSMIAKDRYLILIAALTLLINIVNTTGEYLFGRYTIEQAQLLFPGSGDAVQAAREQFVGETYSRLYSTVNLIGFLLQVFVVARVIKWFGVGVALAIHPFVAFFGYLLMLRAPSLQLMGMVKVADNSLDYSLSNTTRQVLWLATSREAKYKAKQAIDSFGVRAGDLASAGLVFTGEQLALSVPGFAAITLALTGAWLAVARLLASTREERVALAEANEKSA